MSNSQRLVVASGNPVKIHAAVTGFKRMFPNQHFSVESISVSSGVPDQPMTDDETLLGARNRVDNARKASPDADYWIGLEGGTHTDTSGDMQSFAWIVVRSRARPETIGKARTSTFYQPDEVAKLVREGMELGHADDKVFGRENSKHAGGSAGLLTDDAVTRMTLYEQAVVLALVPFKNSRMTFPTA